MCSTTEARNSSSERQHGFISYLINCVLVFASKCINFFRECFCCRLKDISGQVVLITGGGRGLGRELALEFSRLGCPVVIWGAHSNTCEETAKIIQDRGGQAFAYEVDLNYRNLIYENAEKVRRDVGKVDILINNAAVVNGMFLTDIPDEKINETFRVNVLAHFWTVKAFLNDMMADDYGHIVTVSSGCGLVGLSQLTDYCSSKFASIGFMDSLKREMEVRGFQGIRFTVACPGFMDTTMFAGAKCPVIPILKAEDAAKYILKAVLKDRGLVIIPPILSVLLFMKNFVPDCIWSKIYHMFNGGEALKEFVGGPKTDL